jgi:hypothetical protein
VGGRIDSSPELCQEFKVRILGSELTVVLAERSDFERYMALLEEIAKWLNGRGVGQLALGTYRQFADYYAASIAACEVYFGLMDSNLVGSFRLVHDDRGDLSRREEVYSP